MPRHKPPSRIRYEKSHPTISFRLDQDLKTRLKEVLENESFASFVKEALGKRERKKKSLKEAREKAYEAGYSKGYNEAIDTGYNEGYKDATDRFVVQAPCAICGETLTIDGEGDKKALVDVMMSKRWSHMSCIDAKRRYRR